ncbi:hypothetical protein AAFF_G00025340 [Aldrovandia affinis]|uniref:Uncharacterized protein n=1 Tax=Aldrovandia affinis TaxID=143900 RepID=A0AAD7S4U7_9TELE|nr:hypothetical protein AAFF_G00025340 [Aldrovandia affinis]
MNSLQSVKESQQTLQQSGDPSMSCPVQILETHGFAATLELLSVRQQQTAPLLVWQAVCDAPGPRRGCRRERERGSLKLREAGKAGGLAFLQTFSAAAAAAARLRAQEAGSGLGHTSGGGGAGLFDVRGILIRPGLSGPRGGSGKNHTFA